MLPAATANDSGPKYLSIVGGNALDRSLRFIRIWLIEVENNPITAAFLDFRRNRDFENLADLGLVFSWQTKDYNFFRETGLRATRFLLRPETQRF